MTDLCRKTRSIPLEVHAEEVGTMAHSEKNPIIPTRAPGWPRVTKTGLLCLHVLPLNLFVDCLKFLLSSVRPCIEFIELLAWRLIHPGQVWEYE